MAKRWSKQPSEKGLASVGQAPRGLDLKEHGKVLISVRPSYAGFSRELRGWYWWGLGENTASQNLYYPTKELARDAAMEFLRVAGGARG